MNNRKRLGGAASTTMRNRLAAWQELLALCGRKVTRKRVHALRVVTLRMQAELERDLAELPHASHQAQAILRFSKQAEKLRQALSPVRELDVWIGKLRKLRASLSETGAYVPRSMQESIRGIDRLEARLKKKRTNAEKKLLSAIEKRGGHLVQASEDVDKSLSDSVFGADAAIAAELISRFRAVRAEFPTFDEENLHDFRKRIKTVRYLAELHAGADRACAQVAQQVKKMQSSIGEWHDWQELGREALHGRHAKNKPLAELLSSVTAESFESAIATIDNISARMLGESMTPARALHDEPSKPPARSEQIYNTDLDKKLA
jgi:CHAD domain-containing protein